MIRLDILSDPICPWCYLGKAGLDRALQDAPQTFSVEWHPFQLNPDMVTGGQDRRAYLAAKFGGADKVTRADAMLTERAAALGVPMAMDRVARVPNTLDAHRLIHWAGLEGLQGAAVDALFAANFVDGRDIGDAAVLADIAAAIGMDRAVVTRLLASDADRDLIVSRDAHSRTRGVNAVPTFIIANQHAVQGAQPPEVWAQVIAELHDQAASAE